MKTYKIIFSLIAFGLTSPAMADIETEPHSIDIKYEACIEKTNDYPAMMNCVEVANAEWQKEMSLIYGILESVKTEGPFDIGEDPKGMVGIPRR